MVSVSHCIVLYSRSIKIPDFDLWVVSPAGITTYSPHIKQRPIRPFPLTLHAVRQLVQPGNFIDGEYIFLDTWSEHTFLVKEHKL